MSDKVHVELASPERLYVNKNVASARIPGKTKGYYTVLPGHALMMTDIEAGIVEFCDSDMHNITERYFVSGGFVEVAPSRCTILADQVIPVSSMSKADLEAEMMKIEQDIMNSETEEERDELEARRTVANVKLSAFYGT